MRATGDDNGEAASGPSGLEAEAAAWRNKRSGRPVSLAGKIPVVRIRRRAVLGSSNEGQLPAVSR
jgi:hypothetical protein